MTDDTHQPPPSAQSAERRASSPGLRSSNPADKTPTSRGVSFILQYVLGISLLLAILGLLTLTIGTEVKSTQQDVAEQELERIGAETAASLQRADAQVESAQVAGQNAEATPEIGVQVAMDLPRTVTGAGYLLRVENDTLLVQSVDNEVGVAAKVPLSTSTTVTANGATPGGRAIIVYDPIADELTITTERQVS